jgi:hypothetical protein
MFAHFIAETCLSPIPPQHAHLGLNQKYEYIVRRGADNSLAFPISYFLICSTTKRFFLGWVKEVRTTKS